MIESLKYKLRTKVREFTAREQEMLSEEIKQKTARINIESLNQVR